MSEVRQKYVSMLTSNEVIIIQTHSTLIAMLSLLVVLVNVLIPAPKPLVCQSLQRARTHSIILA